MSLSSNSTESRHAPRVLFRLLPGPTRKRAEHSYAYRLIYRNPARDASGCLMLWEVVGGRLTYQIALEEDEAGKLHLHCTCADAVFRAEAEGRFCKHVRGLLEFGLSSPDAVPQPQPCARIGA
jgi:hypothetical protein